MKTSKLYKLWKTLSLFGMVLNHFFCQQWLFWKHIWNLWNDYTIQPTITFWNYVLCRNILVLVFCSNALYFDRLNYLSLFCIHRDIIRVSIWSQCCCCVVAISFLQPWFSLTQFFCTKRKSCKSYHAREQKKEEQQQQHTFKCFNWERRDGKKIKRDNFFSSFFNFVRVYACVS